MTHDLLKNMLRSLDARVVRVEVVSLRGDVFYGNIVVEVNGYNLDIDARPSDALALAVRSNVPILIAEDVMESAGIIPEDDIDEQEYELAGDSEEGGELEDGEERLSVFDDFLENLDVNDDDSEDEKK